MNEKNSKRKNSINEDYKLPNQNDGEYYKIGNIKEQPDKEMQNTNKNLKYLQHLENVIKVFTKD